MSKYNLEKQISDKIRICYMDHSSYLGMNTDNIYKSMKILSSLKNIKLVMKLTQIQNIKTQLIYLLINLKNSN